MLARERSDALARAWYHDHVEVEPLVMHPVTLKWELRRDWEAQCARDLDAAGEAKGRRSGALREIVLERTPPPRLLAIERQLLLGEVRR